MQLGRLAFLLAPLSPFIFACTEPPDVPVTITEQSALRVTQDKSELHEVTFHGAAERITTGCHCTYTTTNNGWTCSHQKHCASLYDLGGDNPDECTSTTAPIALDDTLSATVNRQGCTVEVTRDANESSAFTGTVRCDAGGLLTVLVMSGTANGDNVLGKLYVDVPSGGNDGG